MANELVTNESSLALMVESTEGTYVAPSAGSDYIEVLEDGLEINKTRELLERNTLTSTVETEAARVGMTDVAGTVGVEARASATEGDAPQVADVLLRSLLGGKRQITADQTSSTGHTSTVINFADTSAFAVGDVVLIKEAGAYEVRPIASIQTNTSITLAFALTNGAPSDGVVVAQVTTYYHDTSSAITFSAEHNNGSSGIKQKAAGLRTVSMSIENWSVGQVPNLNFSLQGLSLDREDADASQTPDYSADALPPVALEACAWISGTMVSYTELSGSIENTISPIMDACDADGKTGSRITQQTTQISINPYMSPTDLTDWNSFNNNDDVSFFVYAANPTGTAGEFNNVVALWIPQAKIIESPIVDVDGIIANNLTIKAHRSSGNDSVFLSFI